MNPKKELLGKLWVVKGIGNQDSGLQGSVPRSRSCAGPRPFGYFPLTYSLGSCFPDPRKDLESRSPNLGPYTTKGAL